MTKENNIIKIPSFRIAHCGTFPNYRLGGVTLNKKNMIYLVSVGKEKFEGKWVARFVNFSKEIKPQKIFIVVADSLQRFNIEIDENLSAMEAFQESIKKGQQWVEKYSPYFSSLEVNHEFIFWEKLKEDENFDRYSQEILNSSIQNTAFKKALLNSSKEYTERPSRLNASAVSDQKKAEKNSCNLLQEECAVFQILAKDKDNIAIVYPGAATKVLALTIEHINKTHRTDNSFYWLNMRPTKEHKKNKKLETQQTKENLQSKKVKSKALSNYFKPFFRRLSLDENLLFAEKENKSVFFRRPSLDAGACKKMVGNNFLI